MKEAAFILQVSPRTVAFLKYAMMEQLHIKTSAELVQYAMNTQVLAARSRREPILATVADNFALALPLVDRRSPFAGSTQGWYS